jgi:hypothetical protein
MTTKRKIYFFIPFTIIVCLLIYSWATILFNGLTPSITSYLALILFIPVVYLLYKDKSYKKPLVAMGIYLLLATFCLVNMFPYTEKSQLAFTFGDLKIPTPHFNSISLLIFVIYGTLNMGSLIDTHLDYKESKGR